MPVVLDQFLETLRHSGLMSEEEIEGFLAGLGDDEKPATGDDLAQLLHRHRKLTRFQIQSVYQGKIRGLVLGNYVVLDKIGQGGMGYVYKAQHRRMKRVVALKVLPSAVANSDKAVQRFQREVEAAAKLSHPHVVTAYDADQSDGVHFLVMEFVAGTDLSRLVHTQGPLSVAQAVDYVLQAAAGLAYAHAQGVIHRDIKPSNLLLDRQGTVKILDLGLARFERDLEAEPAARSAELTQTGQLMGTIDFIAPEQAMDTRSADARSDIYSLGCTLFYLLTGRAVYHTGTFAQKIVAHLQHPIPSLASVRDEVPAQLDAVFQRMVAKRPEERPQSMDAVIAQLEPCRALARGEANAAADTSRIYAGPTGGDDTQASADTALPALEKLGSGADLMDDWFQEQLPAVPTVLRSQAVRKPQAKRRSLVLGAIAVAAAFVGLLLLWSIVATLRTHQGTLVVEVDEPGASVQVLNDEGTVVVSGVSDADPLKFSVDPGTHRLRVEKDGFTFFAQDFALERGARQVIRARLEPVPKQSGTVRLTVNQPGAAVEVLDTAGKTVARYRTQTEPLPIPLAAGTYRLLVEKSGFAPSEKAVTVASGANHPIEVALTVIEAGQDPVAAASVASAGNDEPAGQAQPPTLVTPPAIVRSGSEPPPAVAPFDAEQARKQQEAWSAHLGVPVESTNSIGMQLVLIPPGEFNMGTTEEERIQLIAEAKKTNEMQWLIDTMSHEVPQHRVRITRPFLLGGCEVAVGQFRQFVSDTRYATDGERDGQGGWGADPTGLVLVQKPEWTWHQPRFAQSDNHPVVHVSWNDAVAFCDWLSRKEGATYRLPTEAEREYACRAGTTTLHYFGDQTSRLGEFAWCGANFDNRSHPVGQKTPNAWGLFDMHGNLWELCQDWHAVDYYRNSPVEDPPGPSTGTDRVRRGGSWNGTWISLRSAARLPFQPSSRDEGTGFRVAREISKNTPIQPPDDGDRQPKTPSGMQETQGPAPAVAPFDAKKAKAHQMAWGKYLKTPIEITNSIGMKLVLLPPGEFDMGSSQEEVDRFLAEARQQNTDFDWQVREAPTEIPKRRTRITAPCYCGKCEVTMGQFAQFVAATGYVTFAERVANGEVQAGYGSWRRGDSWRKSEENWIGGQTQNHPVIIVTGNDADAFCQWLSSKENRSYRIPTEAEWEYACRAGTATRFPSGEAVASISGYAHMRTGAGDMGFLPVGRLRPNAFGLHDMLGNVAELCQIIATNPDSLSPSATIVDPKEPPGTWLAVVKGGGLTGSSSRIPWSKSDRPNGNVGFRVIQVIADAPKSEAQPAARVEQDADTPAK